MQTVEAVIEAVGKSNNADHFEKEIERCKEKKKRLLDMCLNGYIEAKEYREACDEITMQIIDLEEKLNREKSNQKIIEDKEKVIKDIREFVENVSCGAEWNDTFYRNIVDKIVVYRDRKIDIHLKLIPEKWQAKILAGAGEINAYESKNPLVYALRRCR